MRSLNELEITSADGGAGVVPSERGKSLDPETNFHQEVLWRGHVEIETVRNRGGWANQDDLYCPDGDACYDATRLQHNGTPSVYQSSNNSDYCLPSGLTSPASSSSTGVSSVPAAQMPFSLFHRRRQNSDLEMPDGFVTPPMHTLLYRAQLAQQQGVVYPACRTPDVQKPAAAEAGGKSKDGKRWKLSNLFRKKPASKLADSDDASSSSSGSDHGPDSDWEVKRARKIRPGSRNAANTTVSSSNSLVAPSLKSMNVMPNVNRRRWASGGSPSSGFHDTSKASTDSLAKDKKRNSWKVRAEAQRREQMGASGTETDEGEYFGSSSNRSSRRISYASSPSLNSPSPSRGPPLKPKSRAARTERYIKRLSRDEETSQLVPNHNNNGNSSNPETVTDSCLYYGRNWTAHVSYEVKPRLGGANVAGGNDYLCKLASAPATPSQSPGPASRFPRPLSQNFHPTAYHEPGNQGHSSGYQGYHQQSYFGQNRGFPSGGTQFTTPNGDCGVPIPPVMNGNVGTGSSVAYRMGPKPLPDVLPAEEFTTTQYHGQLQQQQQQVQSGNASGNNNRQQPHSHIPFNSGAQHLHLHQHQQQLTSPKVVKAAVAPEEIPLSRPPTPPPRQPSSKQSVVANRPVSLFAGSGSGGLSKHYPPHHLPHGQQHSAGHGKLMSYSSPPLGRGRAWEPHPRNAHAPISPPIPTHPSAGQNHVIEVAALPNPDVQKQAQPGKKQTWLGAKGLVKNPPHPGKGSNGPQLYVKPMGPQEIADSLPSPRQRKKMFGESPTDPREPNNCRPVDDKRPLQISNANGATPRVASSLTSLSDASSSGRDVAAKIPSVASSKLLNAVLGNERCESALSSCSVQSSPWSVDGFRSNFSRRGRGSGFLSDSGCRRSYQTSSDVGNRSKEDVPRSRRSGIDAVLAHEVRKMVTPQNKNFDFDQALRELEAIYKSLNLDDEELLDRAETQEAACLYEKHMKAKKLAGNLDGSPLALLRRKTIAAFPDKLNDDMAIRRTQLAQKFPEGKPVSPFQERSGSYLLLSPALSPAISVEYFGPVAASQSPGEPDVTHDDVSYRTYRDANATKILDPQPPFGIPLGPLSQGAASDYLHAQPAPKPVPTRKKEPDCVLDDMAFRNLRKDVKDHSRTSSPAPLLRSVKKDGSVDVEGLERLLETVGATSDGGEQYSSVEDDVKVEWTSNPSWNRSVTPSPVPHKVRPPLLASKARLRSAKRFSSHPDLRGSEAAVGVGLVNKFFCVMPLPIERGENPVKKTSPTPVGPARMLAGWDKLELKPAGSVPNLRSASSMSDSCDLKHREFLNKFPKKKAKLPNIDFGPGPIGAIASLVTKLNAEEEEEEKEKELKSVSVSIVDVPASSVTVLSAIRKASLSQPPPSVEIEVIEPKPIVLEETKPKHAEIVILPHEQDERAVISRQPEDSPNLDSAVECGSSRTSTLDEKYTSPEDSNSTGDSFRFHPTPKPRRNWSATTAARSLALLTSDQTNVSHSSASEDLGPKKTSDDITWTSVVAEAESVDWRRPDGSESTPIRETRQPDSALVSDESSSDSEAMAPSKPLSYVKLSTTAVNTGKAASGPTKAAAAGVKLARAPLGSQKSEPNALKTTTRPASAPSRRASAPDGTPTEKTKPSKGRSSPSPHGLVGKQPKTSSLSSPQKTAALSSKTAQQPTKILGQLNRGTNSVLSPPAQPTASAPVGAPAVDKAPTATPGTAKSKVRRASAGGRLGKSTGNSAAVSKKEAVAHRDVQKPKITASGNAAHSSSPSKSLVSAVNVVNKGHHSALKEVPQSAEVKQTDPKSDLMEKTALPDTKLKDGGKSDENKPVEGILETHTSRRTKGAQSDAEDKPLFDFNADHKMKENAKAGVGKVTSKVRAWTEEKPKSPLPAVENKPEVPAPMSQDYPSSRGEQELTPFPILTSPRKPSDLCAEDEKPETPRDSSLDPWIVDEKPMAVAARVVLLEAGHLNQKPEEICKQAVFEAANVVPKSIARKNMKRYVSDPSGGGTVYNSGSSVSSAIDALETSSSGTVNRRRSCVALQQVQEVRKCFSPIEESPCLVKNGNATEVKPRDPPGRIHREGRRLFKPLPAEPSTEDQPPDERSESDGGPAFLPSASDPQVPSHGPPCLPSTAASQTPSPTSYSCGAVASVVTTPVRDVKRDFNKLYEELVATSPIEDVDEAFDAVFDYNVGGFGQRTDDVEREFIEVVKGAKAAGVGAQNLEGGGDVDDGEGVGVSQY